MTEATTKVLRRTVLFIALTLTVTVVVAAYALSERIEYPYNLFLPEKKRWSPVVYRNFIGEELHYAAGSRLTGVLATARISFKEADDGLYEARLDLSTAGLASKLLPERIDSYVETMQVSDDGTFLTVAIEKNTRAGRRTKRDLIVFDHASRLMKWKKWRKGEKDDDASVEMKDGVRYEGPLTGFYNFRFTNHDRIKSGETYMIKTFPKTRNKGVDLYLAAAKTKVGRHELYVMDVKFDKDPSETGSEDFEIFEMKEHHYGMEFGDIKVTLTEDLVPVEVEFMNVVSFTEPKVRIVPAPLASAPLIDAAD